MAESDVADVFRKQPPHLMKRFFREGQEQGQARIVITKQAYLLRRNADHTFTLTTAEPLQYGMV